VFVKYKTTYVQVMSLETGEYARYLVWAVGGQVNRKHTQLMTVDFQGLPMTEYSQCQLTLTQ